MQYVGRPKKGLSGCEGAGTLMITEIKRPVKASSHTGKVQLVSPGSRASETGGEQEDLQMPLPPGPQHPSCAKKMALCTPWGPTLLCTEWGTAFSAWTRQSSVGPGLLVPAPPTGPGHHPHCGPEHSQTPLWGQMRRSLCGYDLDHPNKREGPGRREEKGGEEGKRWVKELGYREGKGGRR